MAIELLSTSAEQGPKPLPLAEMTWKTIEVQVKIEETTRLRRKAILNRLINHELLKIHRIQQVFICDITAPSQQGTLAYKAIHRFSRHATLLRFRRRVSEQGAYQYK